MLTLSQTGTAKKKVSNYMLRICLRACDQVAIFKKYFTEPKPSRWFCEQHDQRPRCFAARPTDRIFTVQNQPLFVEERELLCPEPERCFASTGAASAATRKMRVNVGTCTLRQKSHGIIKHSWQDARPKWEVLLHCYLRKAGVMTKHKKYLMHRKMHPV
jgi:hypothetical protein